MTRSIAVAVATKIGAKISCILNFPFFFIFIVPPSGFGVGVVRVQRNYFGLIGAFVISGETDLRHCS